MKSKAFFNLRQQRWITILLLSALAFFSFLMLRILFYYIPVTDDAAFLQLKQDYLHIRSWKIAFFIHVFTSILTLFAGFTQFSKFFLKTYPRLHRILGYTYVINILVVTGPAAFLMSFYANGGATSKIAFLLLSTLWILFTSLALFFALKKKFQLHMEFMVRSYALTLSAITLRAWKMGLANFTDIAPMDRYRMVAWLGFVLNLLFAEWVIRKLRKMQTNVTVLAKK